MAVLLFLLLNLADAYLTGCALAMGAGEFNPIAAGYGASMPLKGLLVVLVAFLLYMFRREGLLWFLNFALLGIVLWNLSVCAIGKAW